ncbi:ATP-binding protein [Streptomyces sp. RFCAC02]|uniref:ATP-binding protein n=1 Tax=Streptomyces sp. RFCAC02 TaxID=2499143 RepID=UPI00102203EE|nr:ATP-binding protein [Streptomyces sp. RFCAC02]
MTHRSRTAAPLFVPRGDGRTARAATRRLLAQATARSRAADTTTTGTALALPPPVHPPGGRRGPDSARAGTLRLPDHHLTTAIAAGAYPFLAEGGLGGEGTYIGRDVHAEASFCFDPFRLYGTIDGFTNPNVLLAGVIGQGKSALAKSLALRSSAFGHRVYVPCDPKAEWTPVAAALGGTTIALGPGQPGRLNPLDTAPRPAGVPEADWADEVRSRRLLLLTSLARTVLSRELLPMEHTALYVALDTAVADAARAGRPPLLGDVALVLTSRRLDPDDEHASRQLTNAARDVAHGLRRLVQGDLAGMFDAPSNLRFDPDAPMLTIDLSRLGNTGDDTALVLAMTCASAWMEAALADPDGGRRWIIYDEAWRLMRHTSLLHHMQAQWKLARGLGIANLAIIHRLSDLLTAGDAGTAPRALAEGLLADCSTRIIYRQETDQLHAAADLLGLTTVETDAIAHLNRGRGLWKVAGRSFIVQHLLHPTEAEYFDTDTRMH